MKFLMCTSCGTFVPARLRDDEYVPAPEEFPECGGTEFVDTDDAG